MSFLFVPLAHNFILGSVHMHVSGFGFGIHRLELFFVKCHPAVVGDDGGRPSPSPLRTTSAYKASLGSLPLQDGCISAEHDKSGPFCFLPARRIGLIFNVLFILIFITIFMTKFLNHKFQVKNITSKFFIT